MTTQAQRVAIITGASRGIGAAIARRLARDGIAIIVNYATNPEAADEVVSAISAEGGTALAVQADIGSPKGMTNLFDAAEGAFGGVDLLVNNAAVMTLSPLIEVDDESFQVQVDTNLGGVFRGLREAGRRLRDGGRIVSFSSSVVGLYQPTYGVYAATKAAVEALTHVFAKELGPRRITVNAVAPGPVETDLFLNGKSDEQVKAIVGMNPMRRLGQREDIASVVAFLVSPEGGWINGQTIRANGGVI